jgi:hypothetical protein
MAGAKKTELEKLFDAEQIIGLKNRELAEMRAQVKKLMQESLDAKVIRENIYNIAAYDPDPPEWLIRSRAGSDRGTPMTIWSDWHYGEVVFKNQVGGMNEFNKRIARERAKRLVETTVDLAYTHMGNAKLTYPGAVLCLGGDMLGGDIHEELAKSNDRTTQQSIEDLIDLLGAGIETMAGKFGKLFIPCVVGNHGRSTKKMQMKDRVFTSHEWNVYCALKRHFRSSRNIQFYIPEGADAHFKVYGTRYMLTHGDSLGVKGGDGIIGALGPILRGVLKTHRSESQIDQEFDMAIIGHWHQALWLPSVIVNNSLKGYDEFARLALRAPYSRPSQQLWFDHPKHGITARWEIYLEGRQRATRAKWIEFNNLEAA